MLYRLLDFYYDYYRGNYGVTLGRPFSKTFVIAETLWKSSLWAFVKFSTDLLGWHRHLHFFVIGQDDNDDKRVDNKECVGVFDISI